MQRILCLWFPHWPLQRMLVARPELKAKPLILFAPDARQIPRVVEGSRSVRQRGVRANMPLREATALLQEELVCLPHDPPDDRQALLRLAEFMECFSPLVGWQTTSAPVPGMESWFAPGDCLFGEISGVGRLWGGEERLLIQVEETFQGRGYHPKLAIADTVGAAWGAVRFAARLVESSRPTCHSVMVPAGNSAIALRHLPLEALRLSLSSGELLRQLGIRELRQFAKIPRTELKHRMGQEPLERWDQLLGTAWERIVAHRPAPEFTTQVSLEPPLTRRPHLEQTVARLMQTLARQLEPHRRGALRLECRLEGVHGAPLQLTIGLFRPTARSEHWLELWRLQVEQTRLPDAVQRIRLEIHQTAPLTLEQPTLFAESPVGDSRQARRRWGHLVDRLSNRLGASAVVLARLQRDPQPERAFSEHSWLESAAGTRRYRSGSVRPPGPFHRPLSLHDPPRPIQVIALAPVGPPLRFAGNEGEFLIVACSGPERIETGWWRGPRVRRDYFRVETADSRRFWLFRCLEEGEWFLHGEF